VVTPPSLTCTDYKQAGTKRINIFYHCSLTKTNDWATVEDIITDLTAGTLAFATEVIGDGSPAFAPVNSFNRANRKFKAGATKALNGLWVVRKEDNTDAVFVRNLTDWSNNGNLRLATVSVSNDIRDYGTAENGFCIATCTDDFGHFWAAGETEEYQLGVDLDSDRNGALSELMVALPDQLAPAVDAYTALLDSGKVY
jgi:hypothetical protein